MISVPSVTLPGRSLRLTAWVAMALVVMLSVFSASPRLHAWLHAQESISSVHPHAGGAAQDQPVAPFDEANDGCAIVLFSAGITLALAIWLLVAAIRFFVAFAIDFSTVAPRPEPRDWLPPLCGPPTA